MAKLGSGFDIVSQGELERVLAAGGDPSKVVFSGVAKSREEIMRGLEVGIRCFNVESLSELKHINLIAGEMGKIAPISLRVNPDVDAHTHPYISTGLKENKFGISADEARAAYQFAATLPNVKITGMDCHIGSQLTDLSPLIAACERLIALIDKLSAQGIALQHLDLGGGVGIVYKDEHTPDLHAYAQAVEPLLKARGLSLVLEPGRSLVGNAGVLLTRVEYVKHGEEKNFVVVDAAMNDLMRPALYQAYHAVENVSRPDAPQITADIVGPICETGDFIGKERQIGAAQGDILAIRSAGAYASSMASNYNARCRAAEVMIDEQGNSRLVRRRETLDDLLATEREYL